MKVLIILSGLLLGFINVFSQETCSDIIYLPDGESMIFKCCVDRIEDGNLVYYSREGVKDSTRAMAVMVDDKYIELRAREASAEDLLPSQAHGVPEDKHSLSYYQHEFEKATLQKHVGIVLTFIGVFAEVTGYIFLMSNTSEDYKQPMGAILLAGGIIMESVGIPLWISGGIKRANNRDAIEAMKKQSISLKLGLSGAGLIWKF